MHDEAPAELNQILLDIEYDQIREAYRLQPDSADDADDWSSAEEWKS